MIDVYPHPRTERQLPLRADVINRLLGTDVPESEMVKILKPLGFGILGDTDGHRTVVVPTDRYDVERDCDLAEEVCRYVGYNKVPSTIMKGVATARPTERQNFHDKLIEALLGYGLYECETFSFYSRKAWDNIICPPMTRCAAPWSS